MRELSYDRQATVSYARRWAMGRNGVYYDFELIGGDCTNFASQCIYAGAKVMNFMPITGWYYRSSYDRTASWTGVEFLYNFLISNKSVGPYGLEVPYSQALPGDIVHLGTREGSFYHSPVITQTGDRILVAAHTFDSLDRPLNSYAFERARFIHIVAVRNY